MKGLALRCFAALSMTNLDGHIVKGTNVSSSGLVRQGLADGGSRSTLLSFSQEKHSFHLQRRRQIGLSAA